MYKRQPLHRALAAGEVGQVGGQGAGRAHRGRGRGGGRRPRPFGGSGFFGFGCGQFGAVAQDGLVQPGQLRARVDAEVLHQQLADPAELGEGLGLPARAVQGEHQVAAQGLAQRVFGDQLPQVADEFAALAERQAQFDELLDRGEPALLQDRGRRGDHRAALRGHHRAAPQRQRAAQVVGGLGGVAGVQGAAGLLEPEREEGEVEPAGFDVDAVAGALGDDQGGAVRDALAQVGDGLADLVGGGGRRFVVPGGGDQPGHRDHPARFEQQGGEHPGRYGAAQAQPFVPGPDLQRSQHREADVPAHPVPRSPLRPDARSAPASSLRMLGEPRPERAPGGGAVPPLSRPPPDLVQAASSGPCCRAPCQVGCRLLPRAVEELVEGIM